MNAMVISAGPFGNIRNSPNSADPASMPLVIPVPPVIRKGLQLTRRGRLVLLGIPALATAAVLVFASLAFLFGSMASPAHASVDFPAVDMAVYAGTVTVLEGDSLWSIAAASNPNRNVRDVVSEIVALNQLGSGVLQAGQQLFVPIPR